MIDYCPTTQSTDEIKVSVRFMNIGSDINDPFVNLELRYFDNQGRRVFEALMVDFPAVNEVFGESIIYTLSVNEMSNYSMSSLEASAEHFVWKAFYKIMDRRINIEKIGD